MFAQPGQQRRVFVDLSAALSIDNTQSVGFQRDDNDGCLSRTSLALELPLECGPTFVVRPPNDVADLDLTALVGGLCTCMARRTVRRTSGT